MLCARVLCALDEGADREAEDVRRRGRGRSGMGMGGGGLVSAKKAARACWVMVERLGVTATGEDVVESAMGAGGAGMGVALRRLRSALKAGIRSMRGGPLQPAYQERERARSVSRSRPPPPPPRGTRGCTPYHERRCAGSRSAARSAVAVASTLAAWAASVPGEMQPAHLEQTTRHALTKLASPFSTKRNASL